MPIIKLNPLSVAGPRTIVPISSLSPAPETISAAEQPAPLAALSPVPVNRPSFADYQVTAFDGRSEHVVPMLDDAPAGAVPAPAALSLPSIDRPETAADAHPAIVSAAPDVATLTKVAIADLLFDEPVAATGRAVTTDFQTVGIVAFRMLDDVSAEWHPGMYHDLPPLSGGEVVMG